MFGGVLTHAQATHWDGCRTDWVRSGAFNQPWYGEADPPLSRGCGAGCVRSDWHVRVVISRLRVGGVGWLVSACVLRFLQKVETTRLLLKPLQELVARCKLVKVRPALFL